MSKNPQRLHLQPVNNNATSQRYSYLNTPAEYQAPVFQPRNRDKSDDAAIAPPSSESRMSPEPQPYLPFSYTPGVENNLRSQSSLNIMPPYLQPQLAPTPPPLSEHPAQFAPYAEPLEPPGQQQQQEQQYQHLQQQPPPRQFHSPPPPSPGPLPPKQNLAPDGPPPRQQKEYTVSPDSNPLAHPGTTSTPGPGPLAAGRSQLGTRTTSHDMHHVPGQILHPRQEVKGGTWSHGLCDCRDLGVCCTGLFCPCVLYGRTQYRLSQKSQKKDPTNMLGYETCNASCTAMALLCGCQWLLATIQHIRTRRAYDISSDMATDCVRASCCTCCTLIQDEREIRYREEAARHAGGVPGTTGPTYTAPGQMVFSPPPR